MHGHVVSGVLELHSNVPQSRALSTIRLIHRISCLKTRRTRFRLGAVSHYHGWGDSPRNNRSWTYPNDTIWKDTETTAKDENAADETQSEDLWRDDSNKGTRKRKDAGSAAAAAASLFLFEPLQSDFSSDSDIEARVSNFQASTNRVSTPRREDEPVHEDGQAGTIIGRGGGYDSPWSTADMQTGLYAAMKRRQRGDSGVQLEEAAGFVDGSVPLAASGGGVGGEELAPEASDDALLWENVEAVGRRQRPRSNLAFEAATESPFKPLPLSPSPFFHRRRRQMERAGELEEEEGEDVGEGEDGIGAMFANILGAVGLGQGAFGELAGRAATSARDVWRAVDSVLDFGAAATSNTWGTSEEPSSAVSAAEPSAPRGDDFPFDLSAWPARLLQAVIQLAVFLQRAAAAVASVAASSLPAGSPTAGIVSGEGR